MVFVDRWQMLRQPKDRPQGVETMKERVTVNTVDWDGRYGRVTVTLKGGPYISDTELTINPAPGQESVDTYQLGREFWLSLEPVE